MIGKNMEICSDKRKPREEGKEREEREERVEGEEREVVLNIISLYCD